MINTGRVQDNSTMKKIEHDCFSVIMAMCIRGPSAFAEEIELVVDGWVSAKQEVVPSIASDWNTTFDQIKKQRPISWQICEHIREAAKSSKTLRIDDTWFARIASCLAEVPGSGPEAGPDMTPEASTGELTANLFQASTGPYCPVNGWVSIMQPDVDIASVPSQVGLDAFFLTSLSNTGISERGFAGCTPRTPDAEHTHTPFDDWTMGLITDHTTPPPVSGWFSSYMPTTSPTVSATPNAALPDNVYTHPHTTYSRGLIPADYLTATNTNLSGYSSDHIVLNDSRCRVRKWPGMVSGDLYGTCQRTLKQTTQGT